MLSFEQPHERAELADSVTSRNSFSLPGTNQEEARLLYSYLYQNAEKNNVAILMNIYSVIYLYVLTFLCSGNLYILLIIFVSDF